MVKSLYSTVVLVSVLFLTACSGIQNNITGSSVVPVTPSAKESAWRQRQDFLAQQTSWQLGSRASLRYNVDENLSFGMVWSQKPSNNYEINITNPLTGALVSKVTRENNIVTLLADNGKTYRDSDEERLLKRQTNLSIPLRGMQYWVRGLLSPEYKVDKLDLDNAGRPTNIEQAGWKVTYTAYESNDTNALPRKIRLSREAEEIYIRMVAKSWK